MSGLFTFFLNLKSTRFLKQSSMSTTFFIAMPFRRRRRGRRRRRMTRRSFRSRRPRRALVLDPERKFGDIDQSLAVTSTGTVLLLNNLAAGDGANQRIGIQHINLSSLFTATMDIAVGILPATMKIWLVWDTQPNGLLMTIGDLLATALIPVNSPRNLDNTLRLKVLWSRKFTFDIFNQIKKFTKFKSMQRKTRWIDVNNGIANLRSGALYLVFASDIAVANGPPVCDFTHRLRFVG